MADNSIPLDKMIYLAAFQGGMEHFVTLLKPSSEHPVDRFISTRISKPKQSNPQLITRLMSLHSPARASSRGWMALSLVHDLIAAMENNAGVINISGIPTVGDVRRELPPDVALPICTILSAIKTTDELLPAPSQTINREVVARFRELLNSDVYRRYTESHERIELEAGKSALADVRSAGARLLKASKGVLASRRVSLNVIPVIPKVVDAAFGKLPGALAQFACDLANKFMDDRRNLVIYQFDDWANEYAREVLSHLLRDQNGKIQPSKG